MNESFYKFESFVIELDYLDNNCKQYYALAEVINSKDIRSYENDDCKFTFINKDILSKYIKEIEKLYKEEVIKYGKDGEENN